MRGKFALKAVLSNLALTLALAAVYFLGGLASASIKSFGPGTPVWLVTGIGFAAVLFWGPRTWAGIFLGTFLVNLNLVMGFERGGEAFTTALTMGIGSAAEAIIGGELIRMLAGGRNAINQPTTVFRFLLIAAATTAIPASLGAFSLVTKHSPVWPDAAAAWLAWWLGGCGSAVAITPLPMVWRKNLPRHVGTRRLAEAAALISILTTTAAFLFFVTPDNPVETYLLALVIVLLVLWIAFRFAQQGTTVAMIVTGLLAVSAAISDTQLVNANRALNNTSLIFWEAFLAVLGTTGLVLGAEAGQRRTVESALRSSEDRYHELFQKIPQPMWVFNVETLRFLAVNEAAIRHYGYSEKEFLEMQISDIRPDSDELLQLEAVARDSRSISSSWEGQHRKKDGTIFPVAISCHTLEFDRVRAGIVLSIDLTQRKQADKRAAAFSNLGRRLSAARTHVETAQILMETADELVGWDACSFDLCSAGQDGLEPVLYIDTINGKRVDVTAECLGHDVGPFARQALAEGGQLILRREGENPANPRFGDKARASASLLYVPIGNHKNPLGILSIQSYRPQAYARQDLRTIQDLADLCGGALDRLRTEAEILRLNAELETRVRERTAQLEATNRELEAFSYSVSHDLRAPLRSIRGFGEVLLERYSSQLDERGQEFLRRACESSRHMDHLIEDLLKLSRVGRSQMQVGDVDLSALAESIASELRKTEPDRHVEFTAVPGLWARGDERLLRVALNNLLTNAWKFTSKSPAPRIDFGETAKEPAAFFVRDNGAGFDMTYAAKLFGVFQRLHTAAEFPGTGIGLATVQRIINRHGGAAWAEGVVNQGATFYFTLPKTEGSNQ